MRLAVISDLHLDINRLDVSAIAKVMADYLLKKQVDSYVLAGDTFNSLDKTREFVQQLQALLRNKIQVFYLAGNHEMGDGKPYEEYEASKPDGYLHNQSVDFGEYRLIGNNGWYDYSFDHDQHSEKEIQRFKRVFWYDRRIAQVISDQERALISRGQILKEVAEAKTAGQKPIVISHFSPDKKIVNAIPFSKSKMAILKAYLGSARLGEQLVDAEVPIVVSGHVHWHLPVHQEKETSYYNVSLGYETKRIHEWSQKDFFTEWQRRLLVLDLWDLFG